MIVLIGFDLPVCGWRGRSWCALEGETMGVISTAIGKYLADRDRVESLERDLAEANDHLDASSEWLLKLVKAHGPIEGYGHVFANEMDGLVVTPVRNCYTIDREIDLSRAAAAYEPAGGAA